MIQAAPTPTPEPRTEDLLQRFLSDHDAPCPTCGYNLRGACGGQCPECGRALELELAIHEPGHLWRRRGLLLLVFAWLLIAGGINATRAGRAIYDTVNSPAQVWATSVTLGSRMIIFNQTTSNAPPWFTTVAPSQVTGPTGQPPVLAMGPTSLATPTQQTPQFSWAFPGSTQTTTTWGNVGWMDWTRVGAWTSLALLAAAGLIILLRYRRKPATQRVARTLILFAWIGFGGYFAYHVFVFAREWV